MINNGVTMKFSNLQVRMFTMHASCNDPLVCVVVAIFLYFAEQNYLETHKSFSLQ